MGRWQAVFFATVGLLFGACGSDSDSGTAEAVPATAEEDAAGKDGADGAGSGDGSAATGAADAAPTHPPIVLSDAMKAFVGGLSEEDKGKTNPFSGKAEAIESGNAEYQSLCFQCHGKSGKGDGPAAQALGVAPPDFTSPEFARVIPAGVQFQVLKNGVPGTSMQAFGAAMSDEQSWKILAYVESMAAGSP